MKIKPIVGIAIALSLFLAGNIILIGLFSGNMISISQKTDDYLFPVSYFVLCLFVFLIILQMVRELFVDKHDLVFLLFFGLLVCAALAFFSASIRVYYGSSQAYLPLPQNATLELKTISSANEVYSSYESTLQKQIQDYQDQNQVLQAQISQKTMELDNLTGGVGVG